MAEKNFALMPDVNITRSKFLRPFTHKLTMKAGEIVPLMIDEVLPGDSRVIEVSDLIRCSPITDFMDDLDLDIYAFFVPNRLVWDDWKKCMGENDTAAGAVTSFPTVPYKTIGLSSLGGHEISRGSIGDYMGIPPVTSGVAGDTTDYYGGYLHDVSVLPIRGYRLIYNRWFRDQNVEAPLVVSTGAATSYDDYSATPFVAYKKSDLWTRSLPYAQKGAAVQLPLVGSGLLPVVADSTAGMHAFGSTPKLGFGGTPFGSAFFAHLGVLGTGGLDGNIAIDEDDASTGSNRNIGSSNLYAKLTTASMATINQLREAFQTQKLLERDTFGTRYWEVLYSHFKTKSPDASLQDPEYLDGWCQPIAVQQVLSTNGASGGDLGAVGANSVTGGSHTIVKKSFVEHGFLHIYGVVRLHKHTYSQGIPTMFNRRDRYDFYWPEFANLGAMELFQENLYVAAPHATFGYQEAWADYRYHQNQVSSLLRPGYSGSLPTWTMADSYSGIPTLSSSFLKEDRNVIARCLTTGTSSNYDFICDFYFKDIATRPLPMYSIPGLIDHH